MMLPIVHEQTPVPPPAYHRAQVRLSPALHSDALTLVNTLHLLALCRLAVHLALPTGPGGAPRPYSEESLLLIARLRTRLPAFVSRYARLARQLTSVGSGLWLASGKRWTDPYSKSNLNSGNVAIRPEHLCTSPFSCLPSDTRCVLG